MSQIVPTITAENPHIFREQIERVEGFTKRIHIDLMDGIFTSNQSVSIEQVWLPTDIICDIHLMFKEPEDVFSDLIALQPHMIIVPAEATFNMNHIKEMLKGTNIKLGLALLPETSVESIKNYLNDIDHLLIFSGNLGHQGGSVANLYLLKKVEVARKINPALEIGWDGGVNDSNVAAFASAGVDIINTGGYIHTAPDAGLAYKTLSGLLP